MRWTAAVGAGLSLRMAARVQVLDDLAYWRSSSAALQLRALRRSLTLASETEIGREHGFGRLVGLDDAEMLEAYRSAVPIREYEGYRERISRMREGGERDVLWPGLVEDFAQTSGTTAGDKFMPVSKEMLKSNYLCSLDIFAHLMRRDVSLADLFGGRCLFLGGSSDLVENEHGVRTGDLSGIVTPLIRWPISAVYSPGKEIALMSDWPKKIDAMARLAAGQDVRMISGMPSWAGVLLRKVIELTGASTVREVWPNLRVFVHGGVRYDPFRAELAALYGGAGAADLPSRLELYPASEAFVALQDEEGDAELRLCADRGNFFEFVPVEGFSTGEAHAKACWEVEPGVRYVVVLSTCAGLFRYVLGDVVEFSSVPDGPGGSSGTGPARLRIVGRHKHFINAFGENLIVEHIERAVAEAASSSGVRHGEFTAAPVYPDGGRSAGLELVIESEDPLPSGFGAAFDVSLKAQNVDYETKRGGDVGMVPPTVTRVGVGTFHAWLASRGKLGGQHKCPRCANHRDIVDAVTGAAGFVGGGDAS